eukprot:6904872-Pyramimonas_sp.AAC.1
MVLVQCTICGVLGTTPSELLVKGTSSAVVQGSCFVLTALYKGAAMFLLFAHSFVQVGWRYMRRRIRQKAKETFPCQKAAADKKTKEQS